MTSCSGAVTGSLRRTIWSISVKIAVFAPMPRASDRIATVAKRGLRRRLRIASRTSDVEVVMVVLDGAQGPTVYGRLRVRPGSDPGRSGVRPGSDLGLTPR